MIMNWQHFISIIQNPSDATYFVSSTRHHDTIGKIMSALLNTAGGLLIIGYDKTNVHLTGYNETDQWINEFIDEHFTNNPDITTGFLFRANKKILILEIKNNLSLHGYNQIYYQIKNNEIIEFTPTMMTNTPIKTEPTEPVKINTNTKQTPLPISQAPIGINQRQESALTFVQENGSIKNKEYRQLFDVSHKTAHIELVELVNKNKLTTSGSGRSTCYVSTNQPKSQVAMQNDFSTPNQELIEYFNHHNQITQEAYADTFNVDIAKAIQDLEAFCNEGILKKSLLNNETIFVKK